MSGFIFFLIVVFVILPNLSKIGKSNTNGAKQKYKTGQKTWGKPHAQMTKVITDKYGHSNKRSVRHKQMHSKDGNQVFPEEHKDHVREREKRDKRAVQVMENVMHGRKNQGITRVANKGREDWGTRGDAGLGLFGALIGMIVLGFIVYYGLEFIRNNKI
jgi:hypothetical protein